MTILSTHQVIELDCTGPLQFEYDEEWLAIMRSTHDVINLERRHRPLPGKRDRNGFGMLISHEGRGKQGLNS
jgi:hypothetical protein